MKLQPWAHLLLVITSSGFCQTKTNVLTLTKIESGWVKVTATFNSVRSISTCAIKCSSLLSEGGDCHMVIWQSADSTCLVGLVDKSGSETGALIPVSLTKGKISMELQAGNFWPKKEKL